MDWELWQDWAKDMKKIQVSGMQKKELGGKVWGSDQD